LAELVDDLTWLTQSKSPIAPYHRENLNPVALAQRAMQEVEEKARRKGIKVRLAAPSKKRIFADPWAFQRVISNLLDNAVKYTPSRGGEVKLGIVEKNGFLILTVSDSGIGVPEEEQSLMFQEFMRASNARSLGEPGTGLGLAIVKRILEWHGGQVKMVSRKGEGTRVETWWPLAEKVESGRKAG
jgi:signal transduction histidine kinase